MNYYKKFARNIYSQNGDDGVIEKLFEDLQITSGTVLDVGASYPVHRSNTFNLWRNKGFEAILVDPDPKCFQQLKLASLNNDNVELISNPVKIKGKEDTIDEILRKSDFDTSEESLALIDIDVDGLDYLLFESIKEHRPKIIVVEIDSGAAIDDESIGSLLSTKKLAEDKKYKLVFCNGNAYFVRDDLVKMLPHQDFDYEELYKTGPAICEDWYQTLDSRGVSCSYEACQSVPGDSHIHRIVDDKPMTRYYHLSTDMTTIAHRELKLIVDEYNKGKAI